MGRPDECFDQTGLAAFLGITTERPHEYFLIWGRKSGDPGALDGDGRCRTGLLHQLKESMPSP